ncbi:CPBP family intramembrane glutamic endopeptidase [Pseudopedobacter beijingensis]|uniref:CPBP family intramembrane glutamic endopeptidase n=1 Tax=Pseudopedobacter beijingensis TaxID=1207056 RepID=A0ABW4I812_9SPHI
MTESTIKNYLNVAQSIGITGILILGLLLLYPVNLILNKFLSKEVSILLCYLFAYGISLLVIYSIRKSKTRDYSFNLIIANKRILSFIITGTIALLLGIIFPIVKLLVNLIPMPEIVQKTFMSFGNQTGVFSFILIVIVVPIFEELIFRGIILDGLLRKHSPLKSILISSLLFGLAHLNPWQFVTGGILGIFSGWVYYNTRSLLLSIIIHATNNLSVFFMKHFHFIGIKSIYNDTTNLILTMAGLVTIIIVCIYYLKKEFMKNAHGLAYP